MILPSDCEILYLNDSKKLSEKKRELLYDEIMEKAVATGIGVISPARIDEINILQATFLAMRRAMEQLNPQPEFALIDGNRDHGSRYAIETPHQLIVGGDGKSASIAAARFARYSFTCGMSMNAHMASAMHGSSTTSSRSYRGSDIFFRIPARNRFIGFSFSDSVRCFSQRFQQNNSPYAAELSINFPPC